MTGIQIPSASSTDTFGALSDEPSHQPRAPHLFHGAPILSPPREQRDTASEHPTHREKRDRWIGVADLRTFPRRLSST